MAAKMSEKFLQGLAQAFPGDQEIMTWAKIGNYSSLAIILFAAGPARHLDDIAKAALGEAEKQKLVEKTRLCQQLYIDLYKYYYKI